MSVRCSAQTQLWCLSGLKEETTQYRDIKGNIQHSSQSQWGATERPELCWTKPEKTKHLVHWCSTNWPLDRNRNRTNMLQVRSCCTIFTELFTFFELFSDIMHWAVLFFCFGCCKEAAYIPHWLYYTIFILHIILKQSAVQTKFKLDLLTFTFMSDDAHSVLIQFFIKQISITVSEWKVPLTK